MRRDSCFLLAFMLVGSSIMGCGREASDTPVPERTILPVAVRKITSSSDFSFPITFYGRIQPARRTSLAFEIPGQITELLVDEGEQIEAGEPVARQDTSILEAERKRLVAKKEVEQTILRRLERGEREEVIAAARAMVNKLAAELEQANRDRDRLEKLIGQDAVSESAYESALFSAKSLEASWGVSKARLLELETGTREEDIEAQSNRILELDAQVSVLDARIKKAVLVAPFTAHVVNRIVDEGAVVREGESILILTEAEQYEARFSVPVNQLDEAETTREIYVTGDAIPVENVRTIARVSADARTIDVVYTLASNTKVIVGQTCTLHLTEKVNTKCVELPISALVPSVRGLWSVYRLDRNGESNNFRIIREDVTVNHSDGDRVFIESSLPDGSLVISDGVHKLVPGMHVRIKGGQP